MSKHRWKFILSCTHANIYIIYVILFIFRCNWRVSSGPASYSVRAKFEYVGICCRFNSLRFLWPSLQIAVVYCLPYPFLHTHTHTHTHTHIYIYIYIYIYLKYRVIQKGALSWTVNGASTHARQLVPVFQVLCSLYGLTCVGYAQNALEFASRSLLIHVVDQSFCLYTDSLFAQIGNSNDKCSSSLEVECWNEDETHAKQQSPTEF